jgi:hypothetical protein
MSAGRQSDMPGLRTIFRRIETEIFWLLKDPDIFNTQNVSSQSVVQLTYI